jgi:hypothetical protein
VTTIWERAANYAFPDSERWLNEPVEWALERANIEPWSKQRDILYSVRDNPETAVHSCHNIGKSFTASLTCCWWLDVHPPGTAFVVTTAPTGAQVKAILWREIGRLHKSAGLDGRTNLTEWYLGGELVAYGRKPSEHEPTAFQGIHAEFVLVVLDEACGIPKALWDAASTLTSNTGSRTLAIGNPDDPHSQFAKNCKPGTSWNVIHVGAVHTPNWTGEEVSDKVRGSLISKEWADAKAKSWGVKSSLYCSKIEGKFPSDSDKGVIPFSWASACRYLDFATSDSDRHYAGLDIGGGGDLTVLRERVGMRAGREATWDDSDPMTLVGNIVLKLEEWGIERVVVDVIGLGWGVAGRLKELSRIHNRGIPSNENSHGAEVVGFNASETSTQPRRFWNKRAELHWEVGRELSRMRAWDLGEVDDDTMAELTEAEYVIVDSHGRIRVEPKDQIKARLERSPDRSDALLMAYWEGDTLIVTLPVSAEEMSRPNTTGSSPDREAEDEMLRMVMTGRSV